MDFPLFVYLSKLLLSNLKTLFLGYFFSAITERQNAVQELCGGNCPGLTKLKETLSRSPDLEKGLCSIYHNKVTNCE